MGDWLRRTAVGFLVAAGLTGAEAASTTQIYFPELSIFTTEAVQRFQPISPSAEVLEIHISGRWSFEFAHAPGSAPYSGSMYYGTTDLVTFFAAERAGDGLWQFDTQKIQPETFEDFTGTRIFTMNVDKTFVVSDPDSLPYFVGTDPGLFVIESPVAQWLPYDDVVGDSIYLAGGSVKDLSITISSVAEPSSVALLLAGAIFLWRLHRRVTNVRRSASQRRCVT